MAGIKNDWGNGAVRKFKVATGLPEADVVWDELLDMTDVLLGNIDPPYNFGSTTLMELADAYFVRATQLILIINRNEMLAGVKNGRGSTDPYYNLRVKGLEPFLEMCKRTRETGSRRLTREQHMLEAQARGINLTEWSDEE